MFILLTIVLFSSPGSSSSLYDIQNEYQEDQKIQKILEESEAGEEYVEYDEIDSKQEEILTESDYMRLFLLFSTFLISYLHILTKQILAKKLFF